MSTKESETEAGTSAGRRGILPLALIAVACALVGGGVGAFAVGPLVAGADGTPPARGATAADAAEGDDAALPAEPDDDLPRGRANEARAMFTLDNLILNPARTNGTRFLMLTVAFEVRNTQVADQLKTRDAEVRDLVLRIVGVRTVEDLSAMEGRDALKTELRDSVRALLPPASIGRVYLPQFVIQ